MAIRQGDFVWYELTAADPVGASAFYRAVLGWHEADAGIPGVDYRLMSVGATNVAGIMPVPPGAGPGWTGYIAAADVDDAASMVGTRGGTVRVPPADIPGIGRFAFVTDPQGAPFALFRGTGEPPAVPPDTPGHGGWRELHTHDLHAAWPFYEGLFGWSIQRSIDMGPAGPYEVFGGTAEAIGGMMGGAAEGSAGWLYYFNVDGIDDAVARVRAAGGLVTSGPHEVPGGTLVARCTDPAGTLFALSSRGRAAVTPG